MVKSKKSILINKQKQLKEKQKKREFSKSLLIQESVLIWIITISFILLAFYCIKNSYFGELPWLAAMVCFPWSAYGVSQAFYYKKSEKENSKNGIKYESVLMDKEYEYNHEDETITNFPEYDGPLGPPCP